MDNKIFDCTEVKMRDYEVKLYKKGILKYLRIIWHSNDLDVLSKIYSFVKAYTK